MQRRRSPKPIRMYNRIAVLMLKGTVVDSLLVKMLICVGVLLYCERRRGRCRRGLLRWCCYCRVRALKD